MSAPIWTDEPGIPALDTPRFGDGESYTICDREDADSAESESFSLGDLFTPYVDFLIRVGQVLTWLLLIGLAIGLPDVIVGGK